MEKQARVLSDDKIILETRVQEEEEIENYPVDICHDQYQSHYAKIYRKIKAQLSHKLYFLLIVIRILCCSSKFEEILVRKFRN